MRIFIDADGCPVVDITVKIAAEHRRECVIICDTSHWFLRQGAKTITVPKGTDSVDFALVNMVEAGDVVVTHDYGLAAMCLARRAVAINQDGMVYSDDNMAGLLERRHMAQRLRRGGGRLKGPPKRTPGQDAQFADAFIKLLK